MPIKTAVLKATHGFDYYVRSVTTSLLALGILGALVYDVIARGEAPNLLVGWSGIIVGVYFGYHVTTNGAGVRSAAQAVGVQSVIEAAETIRGAPTMDAADAAAHAALAEQPPTPAPPAPPPAA